MTGSQRGVALITVLLVVALVTVVCAGLIARQQLAIRATSNQLLARQAMQYALGGEALVQGILARDLREAEGDPRLPVDHLGEAWARALPIFPVEQGEIAVSIEDLTGRFNLNSLAQNGQVNVLAVERFRRLLHLLDIDAPYPERLVDWLDADREPYGSQGREDGEYLLQRPAYQAANRAIADVSELRLLLDMQEEHYRLLLPYVAALPAGAPLNVNTASTMVLACLSDSLTPTQAAALVEGRGRDGYRDVQSFLSQPVLAGSGLAATNLSVGSQYFRAYSEVRQGEHRLLLSSTLQRVVDGQVRVLFRDLGLPRMKAAGTDEREGL